MNELQAFEKHLRENEKSPATIEKYLRDARAFLCWLFSLIMASVASARFSCCSSSGKAGF